MKVFISWSGELSQKIAVIFRDWLPSVIQSIEPYVSSEDIDKGTRWSSDIAGELADSFYGILCMTPENVSAPWINFEAGALSKAIDQSKVSPFLFNLKRSDITGPLVQFQSTLYDKTDILKLLESINSSHGDSKLPVDRLRTVFEVWWPHLDARLSELKKDTDKSKKKTTDEKGGNSEILEEILELSRRQSLIISDPSRIVPPEYIQDVMRRAGFNDDSQNRMDHPAVMEIVEGLYDLIRQAKEDPSFSVGDVMQFIDRIENPLEYIRRRTRMGRSFRRLHMKD